MSVQSSDTTPKAITIVNGHRPAQEVLDYAYELWAWKHEQSAAAVAKELAIEPRTVQRWARDENWRARYEEERAEQSPVMSRYTTALILGSSAPKAAMRLDAMLEGKIPWDKTIAYVCQVVLDRTGFAPVNLRDRDHSEKPNRATGAAIVREMTDDQIAERELQLGDGR